MNRSQDLSPLTFGNEDRLPRVPLPTLDESCERFLEWCAPLLSTDERAATERAVELFLQFDSPARKLQVALEHYDAQDRVDSWLDTFWPDRYLGRRDRIALNANFFFLFQDSDQGQLERAAALIAAAADYKRLIDEQHLPPVVQRGQPLSMEQNKYLFSATRIPGPVQDTVRTPYSEEWPGPSRQRHIVVFVRGTMFRLDVIDPDGRPYTVDTVEGGLRTVMEAGATPAPPGMSVGHLTTKARAEWAASRQALLAVDPANAAMLDAVETALFCVCLEDFTPGSALEACDHLLHGDSSNRWFDKCFSLIVFQDGTAGINPEHCRLDGTTIVSFVDSILGSAGSGKSDGPDGPDGPDGRDGSDGRGSRGTPAWTPIEFVLDTDLQADVRAAAESFAAYAANTASVTVSVSDCTSDQIKELGMSPDAFAQMAFQLAHRRAKGHVGATYESIATRQYRQGRTEAMRVVTPQVVQFVAAMDDPDADEMTRRAALRAAADKHGERARECQAGQAPEQHLWELQMIQQRRGGELGATEPLALYESPGWLTMRDDYLSTSALPSSHIQFFGFGSTSNKCIGVGYAFLPDRFEVYLSTPRMVSDQMATFAEELSKAARELKELLAAESRPLDG